MARIAKSGLGYFPFDIDFFQDIRIRKLIKRQGGKAVTVYALLLCLIYKNGYYMQWDDELPFICSETTGFDEAYISEVIKTCLTLGLFSKPMYVSNHVLTSKGIQIRYCHIQRLNKRMGRINNYSLLDAPSESPSYEKFPKSAHVEKPRKQTIASCSAQCTHSTPDNNAGWLREFFSDSNAENLRLLCKNFGIGPSDTSRLRSLAEAVIAEWELSHARHQDYSDWSRHLISAMRIKSRDTSDPSNNQSSASATTDYTFGGGFGGQDI